MKILAVIPARAGSQRLPCKNHLEIIPGLSLVQHAIDCARHSGVMTDVCVSSDDMELKYRGAHAVHRPANISGPTADISDAVLQALLMMESRQQNVLYDYVVTLQPAVLARSPLIVKQLVTETVRVSANGGLTMARTVPWQWEGRGTGAYNAWSPGPYPRSQDSGEHWAEINAVQVASRNMILQGKRWGTPLVIAELPPWVVSLDIDDPADLQAARDLWPWCSPRLETWESPMHILESVNA